MALSPIEHNRLAARLLGARKRDFEFDKQGNIRRKTEDDGIEFPPCIVPIQDATGEWVLRITPAGALLILEWPLFVLQARVVRELERLAKTL
jgi:hypothetical protein